MDNLYLIDFGDKEEALTYGLAFLGYLATQLLGSGVNYVGGIVGLGTIMLLMGMAVTPIILPMITAWILVIALSILLVVGGGSVFLLG
mmetsp:Transcript_15802/g.24326  ORF Transcript_15802/g.24326 Transcript_15802/m.24326 type:complete len:88 (-) Transcript_15802:480-743(-)